jgi:aminoglycoside 3-N-acetyltransferase
MSEQEVIARTHEPITVMTLITHLAACGLDAGQTVLVHTRLSALGWVVGAQAVIQALLQVLGPTGTLMMPTQTWKNLDPFSGVHGPVPEAWWPTIRAHWPAYDPATTPSIGMGVVAELFRTWPGAQRSHHPVRSFAALGPQAERLIATHALEDPFGETSPVGQLYALDGFILLLGTDHSRNTSLHLAEHRADYPRKRRLQESSAILVEGIRQWVTYSSPTAAGVERFRDAWGRLRSHTSTGTRLCRPGTCAIPSAAAARRLGRDLDRATSRVTFDAPAAHHGRVADAPVRSLPLLGVFRRKTFLLE